MTDECEEDFEASDEDGTIYDEDQVDQEEAYEEVWSRFTDTAPNKWLELFTTEAPALIISPAFWVDATKQRMRLTKDTFGTRFDWCLKEMGIYHFPTELVEELYKLAIYDWKQLEAYESFKHSIEGSRFNETLKFIQNEIERLSLVRKLLGIPKDFAMPVGMIEWNTIWIGSLR